MCYKTLGLFIMIHGLVLLVISFFVLFAVRKLEKEQGLKIFGYVITALLWVAVLLLFSASVYKISRPGYYSYGKGKKACMQGLMKRPMMGMPPSAAGAPSTQR